MYVSSMRCVPATVWRSLAFLALVALVVASTGCTLIGLGVGAAAGASTERWKTVDVNASPPSSGEVVHARFVAAGHDRWVEGSYGGVRNGLLVLWSSAEAPCERGEPHDDGTRVDSRECLIPLQSLRELRIRGGTHWERGLGIGAAVGGAIDLTIFIGLAIAFHGPISI
jgi:hypothetical protein